ncbi:right-handed parallel beta-helix repeat-containing protein [Neobacillus vireti]|uniref:right-handed parallel beta-helix repeat-containing protein n=1 Tax=Neobacillus vireti TaxID=220686 RepID=UPI002FFEDA2F
MKRRNFIVNFIAGAILFAFGFLTGTAKASTGPSKRSPADDTEVRFITSNQTFLIPSDYATLQEAIDDLAAKIIAKNVMIELKIEKDHRPSTGITIENTDCSQFKITSDSIVRVADDFSGHFIKGIHSHLPILAAKIDMRNRGEDGYHVSKGSRGFVLNNCGIRRAKGRGLYVNESSSVEARGSEFIGCHNRNVWITRASTLSAELANFSGNAGGENAVYVSRGSTANILEANVSNAFQNGIGVIRSIVNCESVNVSNAGLTGLVVQRGSRIAGEFMNATGCGRNGIRIETGSNGTVRGSNVSKASEIGLFVREACHVDASELVATHCGAEGLQVIESSILNARMVISTNNNGLDINVQSGSSINANQANTTKGTPGVQDCGVKAFNTIDGANGIIYA